MEQAVGLPGQAQLIETNFCNALKNVLITMTGYNPVDSDMPHFDNGITVSGAMLFQGNSSLLVVISMQKDTALTFVSCISGTPPETIEDEEVYDGVTELVNMVCGNAKASLARTGVRYELTTPFSIVGGNYSIVNKANTIKISRSVILDIDMVIKLEIYTL